jgi:hypothetical protein
LATLSTRLAFRKPRLPRRICTRSARGVACLPNAQRFRRTIAVHQKPRRPFSAAEYARREALEIPAQKAVSGKNPCPRRRASAPCHAEGRGFESHHPLLKSPAPAGFLLLSQPGGSAVASESASIRGKNPALARGCLAWSLTRHRHDLDVSVRQLPSPDPFLHDLRGSAPARGVRRVNRAVAVDDLDRER